jgi:energy-coupling factor transporter ATP-binding protein EcfA2
MNILVGPNNNGKSTAIGALRALRVAMSKAGRVKPESTEGPLGRTLGWPIPEASLPISLENVHTDYLDTDSEVDFRFSNGSHLKLFFPGDGGCTLYAETVGKEIRTPSSFKEAFPFEIVAVPVLGPVEHEEDVVTEETVQRELSSHRASRHFRNYWFYFPDGFDKFAELVHATWPGMIIHRPEKSSLLSKTVHMFFREGLIDRELYWSGFGFQVWCQMLTHVSRASGADLLIIDEPEIYLHPEVQRQLLGILRRIGPDVLLATHSTEIMSEADPSEIVLVDKKKRSGQRLHDIAGVQSALDVVGSVQNITLTQLARNRRVIFVEDDHDFIIIRRFARICGYEELATALDLTPVKSEGFTSWQRISSMAWGIERTLGRSLLIGTIYDRDFFPQEQLDEIRNTLHKNHVALAHFHQRKEIENYLLDAGPLQRALELAVRERSIDIGEAIPSTLSIRKILDSAEEKYKIPLISQLAARRSEYLKNLGSKIDPATVMQQTMEDIEGRWSDPLERLKIVPGKEVLSLVRSSVQEQYKVNLTDFKIIAEFRKEDVPLDMFELLKALDQFRKCDVPSPD